MISNIIFQRTTSTLSGERVRSIPKSSHSLQGGKLFFLIFSFLPSPTKLFAAIFAGEKSMFYYSYLCATREVEVLSRSRSRESKEGMVMSSPRLKLTLRFCVVLFDLGTTFSSLHCAARGAGQPRRGAAKRQARDTCGTV